MPPLRLGLFGGTFDPPHLGHLVVAQDVVEALELDRLLFVVAAIPPHKPAVRLSPAPLRLAMVRAAVAGHPALGVSEVELQREGISYTVDTLRHYRAAHPEADLFFLMGADQAAEFGEWKDPGAVAHLARLVVMARQGVDPVRLTPVVVPSRESFPGQPGPGVRVEFLRVPVTRVDVSSSGIRERVQAGRSVRYLVARGVEEIIEHHGLYRGPAASA